MDLGAILGVIAGLIVPTVGAIYAYGKLRQQVKDHDEELDDLKARIKAAEDAAKQVASLASAIEHLTEKVGTQLQHVAQVMDLNNQHFRTSLQDIKSEVLSLRPRQRSRADVAG